MDFSGYPHKAAGLEQFHQDCSPLPPAHSENGRFDLRASAQDIIAARGALGRGAELELTLKGGIKADPQVAFDLYTSKAWQGGHTHPWPPTEESWGKVDVGRKGRGPLRHLKHLCLRLGWTPQPQGFLTPGGSIIWDDADFYVVTASHRYVMKQL
eukprot:6425262-Amphidinium_carterae.2